MIKFLSACLAIIVCCVVQKVSSQNLRVPHIACPQYFEYLCYLNVCIGRITLPNIRSGKTTVEVQFSQRSPVQGGYYGAIYNLDDNKTIENKIKTNQPLLYRVDFPLLNELPKLTEIAVNGRVLCSASPYPDAGAFINLNINNSYEIKYFAIDMPRHGTQFGTQPFPNAIVQPDIAYVLNSPPVRGPSQSEITRTLNQPASKIYQSPAAAFPQYPTRSGPIAQPDDPYLFNPTPNGAVPSIPTDSDIRSIFSGVEQMPRFSAIQPSVPNSRDICGEENLKPAITPFILGGTILRPNQFPWLTAVYHRTVVVTTFICGGSLISTRTVLSAAHCFKLINIEASNIAVSLGRHNLGKSMEPGSESRDIQKLITHPEYESESFSDADVALLIMATSVSFTETIKPICLWTGSVDPTLVTYETGYIAGWGGDANGNEVSPVPKMAPANIVSELECRTSSDLLKKLVTSRTFCAGQKNGVGPCMGDSGGGLMLKRGDRWLLRGIISAGQTFGNSRCDLRQYAVYCDVAKYSSWVLSKML